MSPGDMFVAIRGDRFDGNAYVAEAVGKGAAGALVSDASLTDAAALAGTPLVVVPDTIAALQTLANRVRRESGAAVVAVTGSAGKSTTKEIIAEFLAARYTVFRNRGNLNNHIGLPLSLLELRHKPDIGVLELGMNHAGEISALVKIAEPDVRVWTNVGPAHLEFFGTVDAIAEAKAEILEGADKDSLLVANADDDLVMRHAGRFAGRVRTFGVERPADVRALAVRDLGIDGTA
ncbi:MAG: UDP-N-acetylmuramoyl-tripeptide--D-alanyl-D-alanine ligase, partial [Lysobacterales bacterium]